MADRTPRNEIDTFLFIERMSAELSEMAAKNGEDLLSYLFSISREEALNCIEKRRREEAA